MKHALPAFLLLASFAIAADDGNYNMPEATTGAIASSLDLMEKAVAPETLEAFKKANPAPFWLFGEDRQRPVRVRTVPAHWFEKDAKNYDRFRGKAQPGEYYVFQIAVLNGNQETGFLRPEIKGTTLPVTCLTMERVLPDNRGIDIFPEIVPPRQLKPLWFGVQIPEDAKGTISFQVILGKKPFTVTLDISGDVLKDGGIHDGWRLARLKWLNSDIAHSATEVTAPFTPIHYDQKNRRFSILGRTVALDESGLPKSYMSFFNGSNTAILPQGREAFLKPPAFILDGTEWIPGKIRVDPGAVASAWQAESKSKDGAFSLTVDGKLEYDGFMEINMTVTANRDATLPPAALAFTLTPEASRYDMGMGRTGEKTPAKVDWKWNVAKHQDAFWTGGVNQGLMIRLKGANYERPLINCYYDFKQLKLPESWGGGGMTMTKNAEGASLRFHSAPIAMKAGEKQHFNTDWYLTPFKPITPSDHFAARYYHNSGKQIENFPELKKQGVNTVNIHHNRLANPFINYPYSDLSIGSLKQQIKEAHDNGIKYKVYYTTRELTQNIPEFFALYSMNGEIILPRKEGVKWPVTNAKGPHPWLAEHVGPDIVPAWRETITFPEYKGMLDLSVITTPDSRWNNFYLEGLNFLVDETGIDGIYIDDTALDRKSMQRARRILDKDGPGKRKVDMHSWNHYNGLAKFANSDICFMELYPYYDRLWHGEGFKVNNAPLDYMLVEMSGICFGLMSEMLQAPNNWKGLVFGMTRRWPWSGDPRPVWKVFDAFGIEPGIEMIGFWDPAVPVASSSPNVPVTVFKKPGKVMLALANWTDKPEEITLAINWAKLGLNPAKTAITAPESNGFQPARTFKDGDLIPVEPQKGWVFILEETK